MVRNLLIRVENVMDSFGSIMLLYADPAASTNVVCADDLVRCGVVRV